MGTVFGQNALAAQRQLWRESGYKVVFTNGCYDIVHPGHIGLLEQARALGDILIAALNTDESVRRLKGASRPFYNQTERCQLLAQIQAVDAVVLFEEETPQRLIATLLPDVLVKGADWSHFVAGREEVEAAGGEVRTIPLEPGFSTTDLAAQVMRRYQPLAEFYS